MIMMIFGLCRDLLQVGQSKVKLYAPMDKSALCLYKTEISRKNNNGDLIPDYGTIALAKK